MNFIVKINTDKFLDADWPEGVPIPVAGDKVLMMVGGESFGFTVDHRFFAIGIDPISKLPQTQITITGTVV